ncbi:MAG: ATP--guanido phosphotransferase, partial [Moorella sp. (in: Bacteria)]|nr:ATP--guanido phosphotransferase [Moorella sp. (in: firmicutes)]
MSLNLERNSKWMEGSGPQADIVISSRIRLARNLKGIPFPNLMNEAQEARVIRQVSQAIRSAAVFQTAGELKLQA